MFSTWRSRLAKPATNASRSCSRVASVSPPCIFKPRNVVTRTVTRGYIPALRHSWYQGTSAPKSAPKPALRRHNRSKTLPSQAATRLLQPCAMLANGPLCTNAAVPTRLYRVYQCIHQQNGDSPSHTKVLNGKRFIIELDAQHHVFDTTT